MRHRPAKRVQWTSGIIAEVVDQSFHARVRKFIQDEESEAVQLFGDAARAVSLNGDWYGEHVGKWLVTAALAFRRTQDMSLRETIQKVVQFLEKQQESDGYIGTYASDATSRLTSSEVVGTRSWDIWIHAWTLQGLVTVAVELDCATSRKIAENIGNLLSARFSDDPGEILRIGNHQGLSSAVVIEPLARLGGLTGNPKFSLLAEGVVVAMEAAELPILRVGIDVASLGTGKAYQICWILTGLVRLSQVTGQAKYLEAAATWWQNIHDLHCSVVGGPWGGIGTHKEVFNIGGFFSPEGFTETCSTASWMALSRELFFETGDPKFIAAFERSMQNALLGAIDGNGEDWSYFTFPNGRRNSTYHWACCKSSGAMALEELALAAVTVTEDGLAINCWESFHATAKVGGALIEVDCRWDSANPGEFEVTITAGHDIDFVLHIVVPEWVTLPADIPSTFGQIWSGTNTVKLAGECALTLIEHTDSIDHHGQQVVRTDYAALQMGPYIYACGLIDGYKKSETIRLPKLFPTSPFSICPKGIELHQPGRQPILFTPYFETGGRHDAAWRRTWLEVAWQ